MQKIVLLFSLTLFLTCCHQKEANKKPESSDAELKNEVINIVKNYVDDQLQGATTSTDFRGIITKEDKQKKIVIDPNMIFTGLIDEDNETDAIASVLIYLKEGAVIDEHIILLYRSGCLEFVTAVTRNIKVLRLENRKIIAEFHTKPRTSPLYNCHSCTEIVNYQFRNDDFVQVK